ncbi:hypothetical protein HDU78_000526 [Chytriomyces hyalinus]|nr:hypothetical protein HDU78_000526 [Chytriomyces hyalinus]
MRFVNIVEQLLMMISDEGMYHFCCCCLNTSNNQRHSSVAIPKSLQKTVEEGHIKFSSIMSQQHYWRKSAKAAIEAKRMSGWNPLAELFKAQQSGGGGSSGDAGASGGDDAHKS